MKMYQILILAILAFNSCIGQNTKDQKGTPKYGKFVSIILGIHNEHEEKDSLKIELVNDSGSTSFKHQGVLEGWGMRMIDKKIKTGKYNLILYWYENGKIKKTKREILIKPETEFFSLNIELANDPQRGRTHNAIYLDQYTNNLNSVDFKRNWNPQEQYKKDKILLPDYEVTNNNDSILYGAYLRFSSMLSINWVQPHNIAFMKLEQKSDSGWISLNCNTPRIEMELKKGASGKTLKDMVLGCEVNNFKSGQTYGVRINYMINNSTYEKNAVNGQFEDNVYVEQTIYMYTDEFLLN